MAGTAVAGEVAAQAIMAAAGHQVPARTYLGLYSPLDGLGWLQTLNSRCIVGPHLANALNPAHLRGGFVARGCTTPAAFIVATDERVVPWFGSGLLAFGALKIAEFRAKAQRSHGRVFGPVRVAEGKPAPLVIELGTATGRLHNLGHEAGIKRGQRVRIVNDDVSQDLAILGGKGSGKTTRGLNPILLQSLCQGCGALVFNVKGDYDRTVLALAHKAGRKVRIIGVGEGAERVDLLAGVTPEMASTYIASLLLLTGNKSSEATFWNQNASNLGRAILGLLWYFPPHYSLPGLYRYLFVPDYRKQIDEGVEDYVARANDALKTATDSQRVEIEERLRYIDGCQQTIANFDGFWVELKSGVQGQLSQILEKMVVPDMEKAFGTPKAEGAADLSLEQLYEDGAVYVVNAPLQDYGLAAAAAMCFLKLRFYVTMEKRRLRRDCDQTRRVGLFIDECHEIAACSQEGMSDHKFLAMSRDTGTFCVFATQSVYSLISKVGDDMTRALLANLRQRIYFRTEDRWTIEDALYLLGQTEVDRESTTTTRQPGAWFSSKGTSHQPQLQPLANASLIRYLDKGEALALLSVDGTSADDVIALEPVYVNEGRLA